MTTFTVLAFRVANVGTEETPEWTRIGEFIELRLTTKGKFKDWSPEFGKPIPRELIAGGLETEDYFFVQNPTGRMATLLGLLTHLEGEVVLEEPLASPLADFCTDILNSALGPPSPPK